MNNYRVVDIYELADFIADETDEEVLAGRRRRQCLFPQGGILEQCS